MIRQSIRRFPLAAFFVLAFLISWLGWIPEALYARGYFPLDSGLFSFLGASGPTLSAVIVIWSTEGKDRVGHLFARLFRWRVRIQWYVFSYGFWLLAVGFVLLIMNSLGYTLPGFRELNWEGLLPIFVLMLFSNVWEEIGWRGYALPKLQDRYNDLQISLMLGLIWSLWHFPLLLNPDSPMAGLPLFWEIIFSLSLTVIYIWLYNNTTGSLLIVTIFHAMSNTAGYLLLEKGLFLITYPYVVSFTFLAALLVIISHSKTKRFQS